MGVGMKTLTHDQMKAGLLAQMKRDGGKIPDAPDGPSMDYFNAQELAAAIEHEVNRLDAAGGARKVRLDMDADNAMRLASYLRRAVLMGV